jgi:hypothetical protein
VSDVIDLDALWRVAVLSLTFGVGVVGLYALGIRAMATGEGGGDAGRVRRIAGYACFVLCLAVVLFGIRVMLDK